MSAIRAHVAATARVREKQCECGIWFIDTPKSKYCYNCWLKKRGSRSKYKNYSRQLHPRLSNKKCVVCGRQITLLRYKQNPKIIRTCSHKCSRKWVTMYYLKEYRK